MSLATRFDRLECRFARLLLALLVVLLLAASLMPAFDPTTHPVHTKPSITDPQLYRQINARVSMGENYYDAVATEQRANGYPLKPVVTVRLPTLALLFGAFGDQVSRALLLLLCAWTAWLWYRRVKASKPAPVALAVGLLIFVNSVALTGDAVSLFHEGWAALLAALALALWKEAQPWPAIIVAFLAACFREFAAPLLAMMGLIALGEGRPREAAGWAAALTLWGIGFFFHAQEVASLAQTGDLVSPGWQGLGGWPLFVGAAQQSTILLNIPRWLASVMIVFSLFGWASWHSALALRSLGWLLGMIVMIMIFARANNLYWALMVTPLLLAGLAFAPAGLAALWKSARVS